MDSEPESPLRDEANRSKKKLISERLGVSVYHLNTSFKEKARQALGDGATNASIYEILDPVINKPGENIICPRDDQLGAAYVDCLAQHGEDHVGKANVMLSYGWANTVGETTSVLTKYCQENELDEKRTYVWICCLCNNQHRVVEEVPFPVFRDIFQEQVVRINNIVALMSPWNDPVYLRRVWCIFELYTAKANECNISIAMPPSEEKSMTKAVKTAGIQGLIGALTNVKVQSADASKDQDKRSIMELVEKTDGGAALLNSKVAELLRVWMQRVLASGAQIPGVLPAPEIVGDESDYVFVDRTDDMAASSVGNHDSDDPFYELTSGYLHKGVYVDMSKPRPCSYAKTDFVHGNVIHRIPLGKDIPRQTLQNGSIGVTPVPDVELRGITLRQLRAVLANVQRRCSKEKWTAYLRGHLRAPEEVTFYDIVERVVGPFTKHKKSSFVEAMPSTAGTQPPRFFVNQWWGEPFCATVARVAQMVEDFKVNWHMDHDLKGGGMTEDTPIWIGAFAMNQHGLEEDIGTNQIARAIKAANYRTLTVLDKNCEFLDRIWCFLELYNTLMLPKKETKEGNPHDGVWAIYAAKQYTAWDGTERSAVGFIPGGAPSDGVLAPSTFDREKDFPLEPILRGLKTRIEMAEASVLLTKNRILNKIIQKSENLDADPPMEHPIYDDMNNAIRGGFANSITAIRAAASDDSGDLWRIALSAMSKSNKTEITRFNFEDDFECLAAVQAIELIQSLPPNIQGLAVTNATYGPPFMVALVNWVSKTAKNLTYLRIGFSLVGGQRGGRDAGAMLAKAVGESTTIEVLDLTCTDLVGYRNLSNWASALDNNTSLKSLSCTGMAHVVRQVKISTLDAESTVLLPSYSEQRIFYKDRAFPDAMMVDMVDVQKRLNAVTDATVNLYSL